MGRKVKGQIGRVPRTLAYRNFGGLSDIPLLKRRKTIFLSVGY